MRPKTLHHNIYFAGFIFVLPFLGLKGSEPKGRLECVCIIPNPFGKIPH